LGFQVLLVGRKWPGNPDISRPYPCKRFSLVFNSKFVFYAEYNLRLFFFLLFRKADILIANDLDTLPASFFAAKIKRCRLLFDSHEYFPETPEVFQRRFVRNFWQLTEWLFIKGCDGHYTVSSSLAEIYRKKYGLNFQVVRNLPLRIQNPVQDVAHPFIIYQGALNPGRGLELMIRTMPFIHQANLVIAGDGPEKKKLRQLVAMLQLEHRVQFTGMLLPPDLKKLTVKAAVGISIEEPLGQSYKVALPNKVFDYIQARVPVLVSDLPEMEQLVMHYRIGMVIRERTPANLSEMLNTMLSDVEKRSQWKHNLERAASELCWENESEIFRKLL
jgi:glycosyltransferase involved in cell wall biosynthesis